MGWATWVGRIGRTLIGAGLLLLLFVAYQLWGTGIHEARAQDRLERDFEAQLATTTTTTEPGSEPSRPSATTTVPPAPEPVPGDAVAEIEIPSIGLRRYVVEGVGVADLKKGPGHYPLTPLPGQAGNAAIAGHRTTYGAPFYDLNAVEPGDEIKVRTVQGTFTYIVEGKQVVRPSQTEVLAPTEDARLTLTTCEPRFSARRRLVVTAILDDEPAPSPASTNEPRPGDDEPADPDDEDVEDPPVVSFDDPAGLSGDPTARWPTLWWGLAVAAVGVAAWLLARRIRPVWAYLLATPIFLVVLFVFFENVSRLLPANI